MTGKTHQVIGICAGLGSYLLATAPLYNPATFAWVVGVTSLGALLPDVDSPGAKIWQSLPFGHAAGELVNPFLKHRNLTHSILGFLLVGWGFHTLLLHFPAYWGINTHIVFVAGMIAYGSHIIADMVTVEGCPLLFPYQRMFGIPPRPFQGLRIETGHWFENFLVFPAVNIVLIWMVWSQWGTIHQLLFK